MGYGGWSIYGGVTPPDPPMGPQGWGWGTLFRSCSHTTTQKTKGVDLTSLPRPSINRRMVKQELFVRHTLNLTHKQSAGLQIIASAYGMPLTEHVRRAVDLYIAVVRENDSGLRLPISPPSQAPTADPPPSPPTDPSEPPVPPRPLPDPAADTTLILADNPSPRAALEPTSPPPVTPPLAPAVARPTNPDLRGAAREWGTSVENAAPVPTNQ